MNFSICGVFGQFYCTHREDIEKQFSALLNRIKITCFPYAIFFLHFYPLQFLPIKKKIMFYHIFIDVCPCRHINDTQ